MLDYFKGLDGYKRKLKYIIYLVSMLIPLLLLYAVSEIGTVADDVSHYILSNMRRWVLK